MTFPNPIDREYALSQIPWLINETLEEDEARALEAFIATCEVCQAELAEQRRVSDVVRDADPHAPDQAMALEAIAHRLTPPAPRQSPIEKGLRWLLALAEQALHPKGMLVGGAIGAALVLMFISGSLFEPRFETLTSPSVAADGVEIRLRHQVGVDPDDIRALLVTLGAGDVTGPSDGGVIRGVFDKALADEIAATLRSDPRIVFVARD